MSAIKDKIRFIYIPFLKIGGGFIIIYTFLDWFLFIKLQVFSANETLYDVVLPFALPWIPHLIWLWPRIKLLHIEKRNGRNPAHLFLFFAWGALIFPTIKAQDFMVAATGKLTKLDNINSIDKGDATKYYALQKCFVDTKDIGVFRHVFTNNGSHGHKNTVIRMSIVIPIYAEIYDTIHATCNAWIGVMYNEPLGTELFGQELQNECASFFAKSLNDFYTSDLYSFSYLDRVGNNYKRDEFREAILRSKKISLTDENIFTAVNTPFEARNADNLKWLLIGSFIGGLVWFGMILIPSFDKQKLQEFIIKHDRLA
ncbi:MAG TPA: hypothetical protein VK808_04415 [Bacteroidia bacterium]|nr:hypothetical protein [Bacteroidia bacterium]